MKKNVTEHKKKRKSKENHESRQLNYYYFYTPRHCREGCNSFDIVCLCVCYHSSGRTDKQTVLIFSMEVKWKDI